MDNFWSSINPFESDEEGPSTSKNKKVKPRTSKKQPQQAVKPKKKASILESDTESETDAGPTTIKKRKLNIFLDSEDDEATPVRAAALKNFLSRRVASGNTYQSDPIKQGEYYIEVRISSCRELESITTNRWKHSLISFKTATDVKTPVWKAVTQLVSAVKQDFRNNSPVLYPSKQ